MRRNSVRSAAKRYRRETRETVERAGTSGKAGGRGWRERSLLQHGGHHKRRSRRCQLERSGRFRGFWLFKSEK